MARNFPEGYYKKFIPEGGLPERIYKYCVVDDNLKQTLKENYLWFSKPGDFNDPFDCYTGLVDFSGPQDYIRELVMERFPAQSAATNGVIARLDSEPIDWPETIVRTSRRTT